MANRSEKERSTRSLMHHASGTYLVSLPLEFVEKLHWKGRQKVVVELHGKTITIKDWKPG
jgi:hypothetical protein